MDASALASQPIKPIVMTGHINRVDSLGCLTTVMGTPIWGCLIGRHDVKNNRVLGAISALSALSALAACSPAETSDDVAAPVEVADEAIISTAADGGPSIGMFKITSAEGKVAMEDIRADGTYTSTTEGEEPETGTWEQKSPESFCSTPDKADAAQKCYTESVDDAGIWTSTDPDDGSTSTVERVEQ